MIVFASFQNFMSLYKFLSHSKSMPQKRNHDFKEKYSYIRAGTLVPMRSKDIWTKNKLFYVVGAPAF